MLLVAPDQVFCQLAPAVPHAEAPRFRQRLQQRPAGVLHPVRDNGCARPIHPSRTMNEKGMSSVSLKPVGDRGTIG